MGCQKTVLDKQRCIEKSPHTDFSDMMTDLKNIICAKIDPFPPQAHQETRTPPFGIGCVMLGTVLNMTIAAAITQTSLHQCPDIIQDVLNKVDACCNNNDTTVNNHRE